MAILLDTSVLGRLANVKDVGYAVARAAIAELHRQGEILHLTSQNFVEFRNFATRPVRANGLGMDTVTTQGLSATFEAKFPLLVETPDIYPAWKAIVETLGIVGKQVHDARLVAVCHVHAVTHLLTFNMAHFVRMAGFGPGVVIVDPATV
jgi:hypothetical protein